MKRPDPPEHFSPEAKALYRSLADERRLWARPSDLALLRNCIEQFERAEECRLKIASEGLSIEDRFKQPKPNPAVIAERQARLAYAKLQRDLPFRQTWEKPEPEEA